MKYNLINFYIIFYLIYTLTLKVKGDTSSLTPEEPTTTTTIQILISKPDVINRNSRENHSKLMEDYHLLIKNNKNKLCKTRIRYSYFPHEDDDKFSSGDYVKHYKNIATELRTSSYDMMVLDEKFLFSDSSMIISESIYSNITMINYHQYYKELTKVVKDINLNYHNKEILKKGYHDGKLYGLPYELDFDLLYYYPQELESSNKLNINEKSWEDLLTMGLHTNKKYPISMAYGNGDELLDLFVEFVDSKYPEFFRNEEPNFEIFYNETSKELFESFKSFINESTTSNNVKNLFKINIEDAYNLFLNKDSLFFKGKASHYHSLISGRKGEENNLMNLPDMNSFGNNSTSDSNTNTYLNNNGTTPLDNTNANVNVNRIAVSQLPKKYSVMNAKYLVINANSKVSEDILFEVAKQLTSKEMQKFRAEQFGYIPTFDLSNQKDPFTTYYCELQPEICQILKDNKNIDIKNVFKSKVSAPFIEVRMYIPTILKDYLSNENELRYVTSIFSSIKNLVLDKPEYRSWLIYGIYLPTVLFTLFVVYVMYLTFKHRNNPEIKYLSPGFCYIIMLSFIMGIASPFFDVHVKNDLVNGIRFFYNMINMVTFFIPMVIITYRIYCIYYHDSKFAFVKKLDNNHLYKIYFSIVFVILLFSLLLLIFDNFRMVSWTDITMFRKVSYKSNHLEIVRESSWIFSLICDFCVVAMTFKIGALSKRFSSFKFAYIIFIVLLGEYLQRIINNHLRLDNYDANIVVIVTSKIIYMVIYIISIYILVGTELIKVYKQKDNPKYDKNSQSHNNTHTTTNYSIFNNGSSYNYENNYNNNNSSFMSSSNNYHQLSSNHSQIPLIKWNDKNINNSIKSSHKPKNTYSKYNAAYIPKNKKLNQSDFSSSSTSSVNDMMMANPNSLLLYNYRLNQNIDISKNERL